MTKLLPLHETFCEYCSLMKGNAPRTIKWYQSDMRQLMEDMGVTELKELNRKLIEEWIMKGRKTRYWAPKTVKLRLQSLSLFLDWCVQERIMRHNFVKEIPRPKIPAKIPPRLTKQKVQTIWKWMENYPFKSRFERARALAIFAMFIYTGMRKNELLNLYYHRVDMEEGMIMVFQGKGAKDRIIPMHPRLEFVLKMYLREREHMKHTCPYFFTSLNQDTKMGELVIKRLFAKIRNSCGIHFSPHMLRHTFATLMLEGGCDLYALQKMMGHSDITTTTMYLVATDFHLKEQVRKHPFDG